MTQKKLPLINSAHGSETRNIINELIKLFNSMGYTYDEALSKAQDILEEAKQTNDMNENVQQQINTLIAESGTSDTEVLQARIDAEGNEYTVIKERLDTKDEEFNLGLLRNKERTEQYEGDLLELLYSYSALKEKVAVRKSGTDTIDVAIFYNDNNATVYTFSPDNDGWMRLKGTIKRPMTQEKVRAQKNHDTLTGSWNTSQAPIYYTTEVGATFEGSFYGTGCFFKGKRSPQGGMWEIVVDGVYKTKVSCWGATDGGYIEENLFIDLPEGEHTIVGTFLGDDPDHEPSTGAGTGRGFLNYHTNDGGIGYYFNNISQGPGIHVFQEISRKEFAFAVNPASYGGSSIWVPEHGVFGVMQNIATRIFLGDKEVTDLNLEHSDYRWYSKVKILTEFDAYHSIDTAAPMWRGRIDQTLDSKGMHIRGAFNFLQDTEIGIGHPAMLAIDKNYTKNNMVVDSYGNRYELPWNINDDTDVLVGKDAFTLAHFCDPEILPSTQTADERQRDNVAVIKIWNYNKTMRMGEENRGEVYVRLRADGNRKAYYVSHRNHIAPANTTFNFGCTYFIGDILEAHKVLPNGAPS